MEQYVGLDVSQEQTSVCVLDGSGRVIWQGRCASLPEALASTIHARAPQAVKIGLEAGPLSSWLWHELQAMGLPVVCLDARHAKAALAAQVNKTDKNDAFGLAQIVRTGWYREVRVKSFASHALRGLLTSRAQLVRTRVDLANQIRGVLKPFGVIVGKGWLRQRTLAHFADESWPTQRCAVQVRLRVPARVLRKRNDSVPVSMMCARSVSRSTSA